MEKQPALLAFLGAECSHCLRMEPVIAAVERQAGKPFEKLEVWHHPEQKTRMERYENEIREACGGVLAVPSFYNEATGEALCGEQDVDTLLAWATKERSSPGAMPDSVPRAVTAPNLGA